jgi:hypothetical protein
MKLLLVLTVFLVGCTNKPILRIGERVTNGICEGWVSAETASAYKVMPWKCQGVTFDFAWVPKEELQATEKTTCGKE